MAAKILTWTPTNIMLPEQGRSIVWLGRNGQQIDGCVSYVPKRRVFGPPQMIAQWLPLRDSLGHTADTPIKYLPSLWRYNDTQASSDSQSRGMVLTHS